jgi:hypothetical protein
MPCTHEESVAALGCAAAIHARFWKEPVAVLFPWLPSFADSWLGLGKRALPKVDALSADVWGVPSHVVEWTRMLAREYEAVVDELGRGRAQTVVHNDFKADNLAFRRSSEGVRVGVFDWAHVTRYMGAFDVSGWIGLHYPPQERRGVESDLLELYLQELHSNGVSDYERSDLEHDYRVTMLLKLAVLPDIAAGGLKYHNSEAVERQRQYIQRVTSAVDDWSAGDLLR